MAWLCCNCVVYFLCMFIAMTKHLPQPRHHQLMQSVRLMIKCYDADDDGVGYRRGIAQRVLLRRKEKMRERRGIGHTQHSNDPAKYIAEDGTSQLDMTRIGRCMECEMVETDTVEKWVNVVGPEEGDSNHLLGILLQQVMCLNNSSSPLRECHSAPGLGQVKLFNETYTQLERTNHLKKLTPEQLQSFTAMEHRHIIMPQRHMVVGKRLIAALRDDLLLCIPHCCCCCVERVTVVVVWRVVRVVMVLQLLQLRLMLRFWACGRRHNVKKLIFLLQFLIAAVYYLPSRT